SYFPQENTNVEFLNPIINQDKNFEPQENQDSDSSISSQTDECSILDESSRILAFLDPQVKMSAFRTDDEKNQVINLVLGLRKYLPETS
ncbi:2521_t:CDS:2, partial [Racocetra persica]